MDGRARFRQAVREAGPVVVIAFGILLLVVRGTTGLVEFAFLGLAVAALGWVTTTPAERLTGASRRPRLMVFGALATMVLLTAAFLAWFPEPLILVALVALVAAVVTGLVRVAKNAPGGE